MNDYYEMKIGDLTDALEASELELERLKKGIRRIIDDENVNCGTRNYFVNLLQEVENKERCGASK